jgi:hypothetical protein
MGLAQAEALPPEAAGEGAATTSLGIEPSPPPADPPTAEGSLVGRFVAIITPFFAVGAGWLAGVGANAGTPQTRVAIDIRSGSGLNLAAQARRPRAKATLQKA